VGQDGYFDHPERKQGSVRDEKVKTLGLDLAKETTDSME